MPLFDAEFLNRLGDWSGERAAKLSRYLWQGGKLLRAGLHPTTEEAKSVDWKTVFPERQRSNAAYAKQLRDQVVARYKKE